MTTPVTTGTTALSGVATTTATSSVDRPDQMGKDTFLKLLVAQMRYQDPSNPADSSQLMSQTAAFSQVEALQQIAEQNASLLAFQRSATAGALVGRSVTYTDATGAPTTGTVTSVRLGTENSSATAVIGGVDVDLARITAITQ